VFICAQIIAALVGLVAVAIIGGGVAVLIQFSSSLEVLAQDLTMWLGIFIIIYGIIMTMTSFIAVEAAIGFADVSGYFSGSCRLWSTIFLLFLAMGLTAYIAYRLYTYQSLLDHIVSALEASSSYSNHDDYQISQRVISQSLSVSFSNVESTIAKVFNYLFAHAVRDCNVDSSWFWLWVDEHCPSNMHHNRCSQCPSYLLSYCSADILVCQQSNDLYNNSNACAYTICREGALKFLFEYPLRYGVYIAGGLAVLYFLLCVKLTILVTFIRVTDKQHIRVVPVAENEEHKEKQDETAQDSRDIETPTISDVQAQSNTGNDHIILENSNHYHSNTSSAPPLHQMYITSQSHTNGQAQSHQQSQQVYPHQNMQQYQTTTNYPITNMTVVPNAISQPMGLPYTIQQHHPQPPSNPAYAHLDSRDDDFRNMRSSTEDEQMQLMLAMSAAEASNRKQEHPIMTAQSVGDDDLQLALALSLSAAANNSGL
jgi:hypothetical protein